MQQLIIYFSADASNPEWMVMDGSSIVQQGQGDSNQLAAALAEDKEVIVLVPSQEILLINATLPKMNRARIAEALPFALEDQVIGEVDSLHFASGEYQADETLPVAIVAKEKMRSWMNQLSVQPDYLLPAIYALPVKENTWSIFVTDEIILVRMDAIRGFACEENNLQTFITIALGSAILPQHIQIHNYTKQPLVLALPAEIEIKEEFHESKQLVADLAKNISKTNSINLLQGEYKSRKTKYPETKKMWDTISKLALAFLAILILGPTISYFILSSRLYSIDNQIASIYHHEFPQSTSVVAPKLRLQEKLQTFTTQAGESKWLMLIAYLGKGMNQAKGIQIKRLDYQHNQLSVQLSAESSDDFSSLTEYLSHQGLKVKQESTNLEGNRVIATMSVE